MHDLLQQLKERNIWRVLVGYPSVSFVLLQAVEFLRNNYGLDSRFLTATLIAAVVLFPAAVVWNWCHGESGRQSVSRLEMSAYATSAAAALAAIAWYWSQTPAHLEVPSERAGQMRSIAVMPFANESNDAEVQYLCDGIAESLINWLATMPNVKVVSKSASFRLREHWDDNDKLAAELGVDTVLSGALSHVGDQIVVSAALVDIGNNKQLWGDRLTEPRTDVIRLERSIVAAIKNGLRLRVSESADSLSASGGTSIPQAYQHYLRGHYLIQSTNLESIMDGLDELRAAMRADPTFARPYADIADALSQMISYGFIESDELRGEARTAGLTAAALAPNLPEAHTALATIHQYFDFDWAAADAAYETAIALRPQSTVPYHRYTDYLVMTLRFEKAAEMAQRAVEIDSIDSSAMHAVGLVNLVSGNYAAAADAFGEWNRFHPESQWSYVKHALALALSGRCDEARSQIDTVENLINGDPFVLLDSWIAWGLKVCGDADRYEVSKRRIEAAMARDPGHIDFGYIYLMGLEGDTEGIFAKLQQMVDANHPLLTYVQIFRIDQVGFEESEALQTDPRYLKLLRDMNFPPSDRFPGQEL